MHFHANARVMARRFIKGYRLNRMGARLDEEKGAPKRYRGYQPVDVVVRDVSESERARLMRMTNTLPFLSSEGWGRGYFAGMSFPMSSFFEATQFLAKLISPVKERARWFLVDQSHSSSFAINPELFDPVTRRWSFDKENAFGRMEQLFLGITERETSAPRIINNLMYVDPGG